jgi:hypothetical protein
MIDPLDHGPLKKADQQRTAETECPAEFQQRNAGCSAPAWFGNPSARR